MIKRLCVLTCVIGMLLVLTISPAYAQSSEPPQWVLTALSALSTDVGRQLSISNLTRWEWEQVNFPDASLGCPKQGQTYAQVVSPAYIVRMAYNGIEYDYRVAVNGSVVFQCAPGTAAPAASQPVISAGTVVCPGSLATRLSVGMTAKSVATMSLNIRSAPGATGPSSVLALVLPGDSFSVSGGPQCMNNATWWKITVTKNNSTITGWVAEGDDVEYWLEPVGVGVAGPGRDVATFIPITAANAASVKVAAQHTLPPNTAALGFMPNPGADAFLRAIPDLPTLVSGATLQSLNLTVGHTGRNVRDMAVAQKDQFVTYAATLEDDPNNPSQTLLYVWEITTAPGITEKYGLPLPFIANDVQFIANGRWMAVTMGTAMAAGPGGVYVWETATGTQAAAIPLASAASGVAFSPDGRFMAVSSPAQNVLVFQTSNWNPIATLPGGPCLNGSNCLAFSPDSRWFAFGEQGGSVQIYDTTAWTLLKTLKPDTAGAAAFLDFSPDGAVLAVGIVYFQLQHPQGRNTTIALWDANTGARLVVLEDFNAPLNALVFRSGGRQLIAVGEQTWWSWGVF